jgi:hypothetical protein
MSSLYTNTILIRTDTWNSSKVSKILHILKKPIKSVGYL